MQRPNVILMSKSPAEAVTNAIALLGKQVVVADPKTYDPAQGNTHAVLWPVDVATVNTTRGPLARLLLPILDSGALLILTAETSTDFQAASALYLERTRALFNNKDLNGPNIVLPSMHVVYEQIEPITKLIREHNAGRSIDRSLTIEPTSLDVDKSDRMLLARAFSGFERISCTSLDGGKSGCSVWRIDGIRNGRCCEPFIAKIGPRLAVTEELQTWQEFILDFVPFPNRAPPVDDRLVLGARKAVLVSRLVDRATRFDKYVRNMDDPGGTIAALFNGALRTWRSNASTTSDLMLGEMYVRQMENGVKQQAADTITGRVNAAILPDTGRLKSAFELALATDKTVLSPVELMKSIRQVPAMTIRMSLAHGDLNARNLFVAWSSDNVILIDFSHAGAEVPLSRDPSRLEVSIAFDVPDNEGRFLPDETLLTLYSWPLLPSKCGPRRHDGRVEAIHQIRRHVAGEGIANEEYALTTACHLLRYARSRLEPGPGVSQEQLKLRCLAYTLASRIVSVLTTK